MVLSSRFADIFRGNSQKAGLLTVILPQNEIESIWQQVESDATTSITVDLSARKVSYTSANSNKKEINFEIDDYTRWRLMEGLDDIGLTMKRIDQVEKFESERHTKFAFKPKTLPVKA